MVGQEPQHRLRQLVVLQPNVDGYPKQLMWVRFPPSPSLVLFCTGLFGLFGENGSLHIESV